MIRFTVFAILLLLQDVAFANLARFESVRALVATGHSSAAIEELQSMAVKNLDKQSQALWHFGHGILAYESHQWQKAKESLEKALEFETDLAAYVYHYIGQAEKSLGNIQAAKKAFTTCLKLRPSLNIKYETRFALGEIAVLEKHWLTAYKHFRYLQKRWKNSDHYPTILWRLVAVDLERKKKWRACRWARNLYRNFPAHSVTYDWGIDLQNVEIKGVKTGCLASPNDQERRIRRLQWAGESQRARKELEILSERATGPMKYQVDLQLSNFLTNEGFVDEAVQVLLNHYKSKKNNFDYLMLLARAAAKAGEFQTAVGAYYKSHLMRSRRSRSGKEALFKAAFLSYQFQDYDGAGRKFERFTKLYPRSGLSRDAQWHLAWLRYLKGNYDGALKSFKSVYSKAKRRRWRWKRYPLEKIRYWMGMSHYRKKRFDQARTIFEDLVKDAPFDFYSQAAKSRLQKMPPVSLVTAGAENEEEERIPAGEMDVQVPETLSVDVEPQPAVSEEEESEEALMAEPKDDLAENEIPVDGEEEIEEPEETLEIKSFKSKSLQAKFDRAQRLIAMGFYSWAKWELYEIEKRTRNKAYLRMLMQAYEGIHSYNRSSYIAQIHFSKQRHKEGLDTARRLWEYAYPKAFESAVTHYSTQFGISKEFIWGLMRAESRYKADISSPVGARGLMQLMPHTATQVSRLLGDESFNVKTLTDPDQNIRLGSRYLHRLAKKFDNHLPLMAAGYNAGPHRVEGWLANFGNLEMDEFIEHIPFVETRNYVKKVIRNYSVYKALYTGDRTPIAWLPAPVGVPAPTHPATRETWESL